MQGRACCSRSVGPNQPPAHVATAAPLQIIPPATQVLLLTALYTTTDPPAAAAGCVRCCCPLINHTVWCAAVHIARPQGSGSGRSGQPAWLVASHVATEKLRERVVTVWTPNCRHSVTRRQRAAGQNTHEAKKKEVQRMDGCTEGCDSQAMLLQKHS